MKKVRNLFLIVTVVLILLMIYAYFQRDTLLTYWIRFQVRNLLGTDCAPQKARIFKSKDSKDWIIQIPKMMIKNPDRFEIPNMVQLGDVQIAFDPWRSLVESRWRIRYFYVSLTRVNFQNNSRGIFNFSTTPSIRALYTKKSKSPRRDFLIESLEFKLGKLYRLDYSKAPPGMELYSLKGRRVFYRNIDDPQMLVQAPALLLLEHIHDPDKDLINKLKAKVEAYQDSLEAVQA